MNIRLGVALFGTLLAASACSSTSPASPQLASAVDGPVHGAVPGGPGVLDSDNQPKFLHSGINSVRSPPVGSATVYQ